MRGGAAAALAVIGMVVASGAVAQEEGFVGRRSCRISGRCHFGHPTGEATRCVAAQR